MNIFIENEAGSDKKHIFNEKTLQYKKTVTVSRTYPFPYGFIPNTASADGGCLDCFVLTTKQLTSQQVVECEPIGLVEQFEDGMQDHKILAVLEGENYKMSDEVKHQIKEFIGHVFDHLPNKTIKTGRFLDKKAAEELIHQCSNDLQEETQTF